MTGRMSDAYALSAIRREHTRVSIVAQKLDRERVPIDAIARVEAAMLLLDDAVNHLEASAGILEEDADDE